MMKALAFFLVALLAAPVMADNVTPVRADPALVDSGLMQRLGALFRFRTRQTIAVVEDDTATVSLLPGEDDAWFETLDGAKRYALSGKGAFVDWLRSDAGKRAVAGYKQDGAPLYRIVTRDSVVEDVARRRVKNHPGEELALRHCGRCHVIGPRNKYGGIGSTPSFPALRTIPHWEEKFAAFWVYNPHPAFTQIEGVTEPFPEHRPSPIAPLALTPEEAESIADFAATIPPADLGRPITLQ